MIRELTVTQHGKVVSRVPLPQSGILTIGRDGNSDLVLASPYVSRHHAELRRAADGWTIVDTSANGVLVRGLRLPHAESFALSAGDQIVIGDYTLLCDVDDTAELISRPLPTSTSVSEPAVATADMTFRATGGSTFITASTPFAYGRASVLFRGQGESRDVCVKLFPNVAEDELRAFATELRVQISLNHPNILPVLDSGLHADPPGSPFVVLPFCAGGSVRDLLRERSFYSVTAIAPLLIQLAAAIDFAHGSGIIHGDIKPENVLLSLDRKQAFLSDFGMAKVFALKESFSTVAAPMLGGTTAYLSPEQITGNEQSPLSDVYAFAVTAYELLTGHLPFDRTLPPFQQMTLKVSGRATDPVRFNPMLGDSARRALLSGLATDPLNRPRSASILCELLTATGQVAAAQTKTGASKHAFVSYSHRDKRWLERVADHLRPLERDGRLVLWSDQKIRPGTDWRAEIADALQNCSCAVLLVSSHFLASDFCVNDELPVLLDAAAMHGLSIFPVILSPCHLESSPRLAALQAVNSPSRTLMDCDRAEQERILAQLAKSIADSTTPSAPR